MAEGEGRLDHPEDESLEADFAHAAEVPSPSSPTGGRTWMIVACVFAGLFMLAAAGAGVSYARGSDWEKQAIRLESDVKTRDAEIRTLEVRIETLSGEKAAAEDLSEIASERAATMGQLAGAAKLVADDMEACVDGVQQLTDYIININFYDFNQVYAYAGDVGRWCGEAKANNSYLNQLITLFLG